MSRELRFMTAFIIEPFRKIKVDGTHMKVHPNKCLRPFKKYADCNRQK